MAGYTVAIFGKNLWWNGSELFLTFFLTEYLHLAGHIAAFAVATGLVTGAVLDLVLGSRRRLFDSAARAGRLQLCGALGALGALALCAAAYVLPAAARWPIIVVASLLFRTAYVVYDLPQNCIMSLVDWSSEQRRRAAAGRTVASSASLILLSLTVSEISGPASGSHHRVQLFIVIAAAIATLSAIWLWRATHGFPSSQRLDTPQQPRTASLPIALMAVVCLTLPAFSKFAPYVVLQAGVASPFPIMLASSVAMILSQPLWLRIMRASGENRSNLAAGCLLVASAALLLDAPAHGARLAVAAILVGCASGGLSTAIWSNFASQARGQSALDVAPTFARFTAVTKLALAGAAILIGTTLEHTAYGRDTATLFQIISLLMLAGGCGVMLISLNGLYRVRHGAAAPAA